MSFGAAEVEMGPGQARVRAGEVLPLARLLIGRPAAEAADLLPRLFNLCPMAQANAARLALGLPLRPEAEDEVVRDHFARIFVTLRLAAGLAPVALPARLTAQAMFGPCARLPATPADLAQWLAQDLPAAGLVRAVSERFAPGQGVVVAMPFPRPSEMLSARPFENSPAGRQAAHPLLQALEALQGRGPLWRLAGLLADVQMALADGLAPPEREGHVAVVQAARGAYALRLDVAEGHVTRVTRRTPTDHQLAHGGALEQALATTPPPLAPLVLALHDPCVAVTLREAAHA